jgi:hypothetical protein
VANLSVFARKLCLDWLLGGAAAAQPAQHWLGLSYGSPTSVSASELATGSGYTRVTIAFGAGASPGGSESNNAAVSYSAITYASTVSGYQMWDTQAVGAGNMLWAGLLSAATRPSSVSGFTCAAGSALFSAL